MDDKSIYILVALYGNFSILLLFISNFLKKYKLILTYLILINLAFMISIRDQNVALDTKKYVFLFISNNLKAFWEDHTYDIGYFMLNKIIHLYTNNYHIFLFAISLLHILIIYFLYKNLSNRFYPILIAIYISTFVFWLSNLSMLRQGIAIPLFDVALYYLIFKKKIKIFLLISIVASLIHFSVIPMTLFSMFFVFLYGKMKTTVLKICLIIEIIFIIYPENLFMNLIINILHILPRSNVFIDKILWYFEWNKLEIWHIKHVYFLIILLFLVIALFEKDKKIILLTLLPVSLLAFFKSDEMVTDRLFMYFVPFIPFFILNSLLNIKFKTNTKHMYYFLITIIFIGVIIWFNVKFLYLQYGGWFIYPYPNVR